MIGKRKFVVAELVPNCGILAIMDQIIALNYYVEVSSKGFKVLGVEAKTIEDTNENKGKVTVVNRNAEFIGHNRVVIGSKLKESTVNVLAVLENKKSGEELYLISNGQGRTDTSIKSMLAGIIYSNRHNIDTNVDIVRTYDVFIMEKPKAKIKRIVV